MDFGSEFGAVQSGRAFRNPGISLCHVAFRSAALLVYLFGGLFSSSFIGVFVAVVLLLSIDFWTVKNVTGRIMVSGNITPFSADFAIPPPRIFLAYGFLVVFNFQNS